MRLRTDAGRRNPRVPASPCGERPCPTGPARTLASAAFPDTGSQTRARRVAKKLREPRSVRHDGASPAEAPAASARSCLSSTAGPDLLPPGPRTRERTPDAARGSSVSLRAPVLPRRSLPTPVAGPVSGAWRSATSAAPPNAVSLRPSAVSPRRPDVSRSATADAIPAQCGQSDPTCICRGRLNAGDWCHGTHTGRSETALP